MHVSIKIPEVAEYPKGFPDFWLRTMFVRPVSQDFRVHALASTYVRLVEAALVEYELGAAKVREFWSAEEAVSLSAIARSSSHFESCISDMHRATNCFRRLRRNQLKDSLCARLKSERAAFATQAAGDEIRLMRNEIHHLENSIIEGQLRTDQPIALIPYGPEQPHPTEVQQTLRVIDRLVITGFQLPFTIVAAWLTEMGRVAQIIASFDPPNLSSASGA